MNSKLKAKSKYFRRLGAGAGAVLVAALLAACADRTVARADYTGDQCRRVALINPATGGLIVGAEDLALDALGGRLFVSAYDRHAVERAVRRKAFDVPEGGLFEVSLADLWSSADSAVARPLIAPSAIPGGLRPHGIALDVNRGEIVFVNRAFQRINGAWRLQATIERVDISATSVHSKTEGVTTCSANAVTVWNEKSLLSFDRPVCGWRAMVNDVQGLRRSGVMDLQGRKLFAEAKFANGVVALPSGDIALADTRAGAVLIARDDGAGGLREVERFDVPGGPDNLKLSEGGSIIVAVHPSMLRMAFHRIGNIGRAPSRVVLVSPETGEVSLLFDDQKGVQFAAATSAVTHRGALIAGSALDVGLLVCQPREPQTQADQLSPL